MNFPTKKLWLQLWLQIFNKWDFAIWPVLISNKLAHQQPEWAHGKKVIFCNFTFYRTKMKSYLARFEISCHVCKQIHNITSTNLPDTKEVFVCRIPEEYFWCQHAFIETIMLKKWQVSQTCIPVDYCKISVYKTISIHAFKVPYLALHSALNLMSSPSW